jgi:hypothetical protein
LPAPCERLPFLPQHQDLRAGRLVDHELNARAFSADQLIVAGLMSSQPEESGGR